MLGSGNGNEVDGLRGVEKGIGFQVDTREGMCCTGIRQPKVYMLKYKKVQEKAHTNRMEK